MKIGSLEIKKARFGNTEITKMYLGSLLVYQKTEEGLPARYQKVAYLEATGVQWLNSGIYTSENMSCEIEFEFTDTSGDSQSLVACSYDGSNRVYLSLLYKYQPKLWYEYFVYSTTLGSTTIEANTRYKQVVNFSNGSQVATINGESDYSYARFSTQQTTKTLYIFAENYYGSNPASKHAKAKIYNLKINNHQFVPCYDTENGNKPGMYDLVSRQFLVNQGTGADFIVGPDVHDLPAEFQEVEYLQGDGNAYIGNIWQPTLNMKVETSFQCQTITSIEGIFGYYDVGGTNIRYGIRVSSTGAIQVANWTTSWTSVGITYDTNKHKYIIDSVNDMFYYDDQSFSIPKTKTDQLGTQNNTLFAYYGNYESKGKMFYQKVWEGTTLTHHYIPCYNKTTLVAGMYDLITKQFKTNSGTGSFIVGPDIN